MDAVHEPLNIEAILAESEREGAVLLGAAAMGETGRASLGLSDFYQSAVKQGFDPKSVETAAPGNVEAPEEEVRVDDYIGPWTVSRIRAQTNNGKGVKKLTVRINSPGGMAFSAYGLYAFLRQISRDGGEVTTAVQGRASSAAAITFMAGDRRWMDREMSLIMFHRSLGMMLLFATGNSEDIAAVDVRKIKANAVNPLQRIDRDLVAMLEKRTKMKAGDIEKMLRQDSYFNAADALERGIATEYTPETGMKDKPKAGDKESKPAGMGETEPEPENPGRHADPEREANVEARNAYGRDVLSYFVTGRAAAPSRERTRSRESQGG